MDCFYFIKLFKILPVFFFFFFFFFLGGGGRGGGGGMRLLLVYFKQVCCQDLIRVILMRYHYINFDGRIRKIIIKTPPLWSLHNLMCRTKTNIPYTHLPPLNIGIMRNKLATFVLAWVPGK